MYAQLGVIASARKFLERVHPRRPSLHHRQLMMEYSRKREPLIAKVEQTIISKVKHTLAQDCFVVDEVESDLNEELE